MGACLYLSPLTCISQDLPILESGEAGSDKEQGRCSGLTALSTKENGKKGKLQDMGGSHT